MTNQPTICTCELASFQGSSISDVLRQIADHLELIGESENDNIDAVSVRWSRSLDLFIGTVATHHTHGAIEEIAQRRKVEWMT